MQLRVVKKCGARKKASSFSHNDQLDIDLGDNELKSYGCLLQVTVVVNYDMPVEPTGKPDFETYLRRIGRTGRFGKSGIAVNFIDGQRSMAIMKKIEEHFGKKILPLETDDVLALEKLAYGHYFE